MAEQFTLVQTLVQMDHLQDRLLRTQLARCYRTLLLLFRRECLERNEGP